MERKLANYGNFLPILTKIQLCLELKYKILAIIKNTIKTKRQQGCLHRISQGISVT